MEKLIKTIIGIEMFGKMDKANTIERVALASTVEEKTAVVQETEKFVFEVVEEICKKDSELDDDGIKAKNELTKQLIAHQYFFFNLDNPFENGTTFEGVRIRNGRSLDVSEDEQFFA